jgi:cell division septal protein FtsQ
MFKKRINYYRLEKPKIGRASRLYYLERKIKWRRRVLISLALVILAGFFYFFFYSDFFKIQEITVVDMNQDSKSHEIASVAPSGRFLAMTMLAKQALDQKRFLIFSQKNIFLFDKNQLKDRILAKYNLEELKILKKLPRKLEIRLKEKLPFLILNYFGDSWFVDQKGLILEKTSEEKTEENQLPLVSVEFPLTNPANPEISIKQKIFTERRVWFIKEIFLRLPLILSPQKEELREKKIDILYFIVPSPKEPKVVVKTAENWEIYFNSLASPEEQLQKLELILKEKIRGDRKNLKYIDLRFGERVYYR